MKTWYQKITTIAFWYAGLSVIIGPAIPILIYSQDKAGGDCYDPTWGNTPLIQRADYYMRSQATIAHLAEAMIAIGLVILILLVAKPSDKTGYRSLVATLLVVFMMACYYALVLFAHTTDPCGAIS